ncbi:MAG: CHASE3 domain-containing protein [Pseudomonadota bacterium]
MRAYADLKTRTKIGLGVAAPLLLGAVIGAVALISINSITYKAQWVDHTRKVLADSSEIIGAAVDMETGMRGYLLAGEDAFLEPYDAGASAVYQRIDDLQRTVSDNPGQVARLGEAERVLRDWQSQVAETQIALRREIGDARTMNDMAKLVGEARGKQFFDAFRAQIATFVGREEALLDERRRAFEQQAARGGVSASATREAMDWVTHTYFVISEAKRLLAAAVDMETGMRGYLLAGRSEFLEPYNAGRALFFSKVAELKTTVSDNPPQVALLGEIEATIQEWLAVVVEPMISLRAEIGDSKTMDDMADVIGEARGKMFFDEFRGLLATFAAEERELMAQRQAEKSAQENFAFWAILGGVLASFVIGAIAAMKIGASISGPIKGVTHAMQRLAEGDTAVEISGAERADEVGEIAKATQVFKENALRMQELAEAEKADRAAAAARQEAMATLQTSIAEVVTTARHGEFSNRINARFEEPELQELADGVNGLLGVVEQGLDETGRVLAQVAQGDLGERMTGQFEGAFARLQSNVNETVERLADLVGEIAATTETVRRGADDISAGAGDLSQRAEQQASSLEETAATMEEMSASIKTNADGSARASTLAADASDRADAGGGIVKNAVAAMNEIEASAAKITDIISVIDGIAFQTNLLALNAAVEAARAGDAGKGFAVVASEVRSLAQRSSEAARDIRGLIETSAGQVSEGVKLVTETGASLEGIVASISEVEAAITGIAEASVEQASGVEEISNAVSHMDQMTQQNSSMAEESASNARALASGAKKLKELISFFKAAQSFAAAPAAPEPAADAAWRAEEAAQRPAPAAAPRSIAAAPLSAASVAASEEWADF